jgi:hypothetical protein
MHWTYALYLFMCTAHSPIFLTLLAVGKYVPQMRLVHNQTLLLQSTTLCLHPIKTSLSVDAGLAALMAVAIGLLFMVLNDTTDDEPSAALIATRACFWFFVWFHGRVMHCGWPTPVISTDAAVSMRILALWCFSRSAPIDKGALSFAGATGAYGLWLFAFISYHWGFPPMLFLLQLLLDALLVLSHRYDDRTTLQIMLNCRICYVALSGCILHGAALFA